MSRHHEHSATERRLRPARALAISLAAACGILMIAGCSALTVSPTPTASSSLQPGTPGTADAATPTPQSAPTLDPQGSADDNLPLFAAVVDRVWGSADQVSGRAYVDALVAAGFQKAAMQVTQDETTVGNPAESIQFSVRWGDQCLLGQVGPATGGPVAIVAPGLAQGTCLVGKTRPIDW